MDELQHTEADRRQVVVRQIGDVRVTLDMPEGMTVPQVELRLHRHEGDVRGRLAALDAFGMTDEEHLREVDHLDYYWYRREVDSVEATVWFDRSSRPAP